MTKSDPTTPGEVVTAFIGRVEAGDIDSACSLLAADVVYENVGLPVNHGRDTVTEFLGNFLGMTTAVQWVVHRQIEAGDTVANERTDRFLIRDRWRELPVAGFFEVRAGHIALWRDYFDMAAVGKLLED